MGKIAPIFIILMTEGFAFWYAYQIFRGKIKPALATWIMMLTGGSLSLITFFIASDWDIKSGILNLADVLGQIIILSATIILSKVKNKFRPFEKWYLFFAFAIVIFWSFSKNSIISNLLSQTLMLSAYFPTIHKLISEKTNTESYFSWLLGLSAGFLALFIALESKNFLSLIYSGRTIFMISAVLILMFFCDKKVLKHREKKLVFPE